MEISYIYLSYFFVVFWLFTNYAEGDNFCNVKNVTTIETPCRKCYMNYGTRCPPGTTKLSMGRGLASCYISMSPIFGNAKVRGCLHRCRHTIEIKKCCPGSWGADCDDCPGGAISPCNGNGKCNDTILGTGECACQKNFTGYACERCAQDNVFGRECDNVCQCVHGTCDSGRLGDGSCSCDSGYNGTLCDQELAECKNKTCPDNSRCVDVFGHVMCTCNYGYKRVNLPVNGTNDNSRLNDTSIANDTSSANDTSRLNDTSIDNDTSSVITTTCVEINACEENDKPLCHQNATCTSTGPSTYNCTCLPGYHGDGYVCDPIDPCQEDNGGCNTNTSVCQYIGPGQHTCKCLRGYEMDVVTKICHLIDVCSFNASYCDDHATCTNTGPLEFDCTCNEGYDGTGYQCFNNIADLVKDLNEDDDIELKGKMILAGQLISKYYYNELRNDGPFTLFIPLDRGFRTVLRSQSFEEFMADADTARQVLRQHIIVGEWTLDQLAETSDLYTLQGVPAEIQAKMKSGDIFYRYKLPGSTGTSKTTVIKGNIQAANGIIHVIGKMLTKDPEVKGDITKSMLDLIKKEGQYNRLESLISKADMKSEVEAENITMFTPQNSAWDSLPAGALDYFTSMEGRDALRQMISNHIFEGVIEAADLISLNRIRSNAGIEVAVSVSEKGQILLNDNISISQTDIPAKNGLYHHIQAVLLPDHINSLLPSQCDEETSEIVVGHCGSCNDKKLPCPASTDVPIEGEVRTGCEYQWKYGLNFRGCAQVCNRTSIRRQCCPNFYSIDCHPCPGGFQNPCSGNGQCLDRVDGNGTCVCNPGFTGTICSECEDPNMFGPYCNQSCTCMKGTCKNTIESDGTCSRCQSFLYLGDNCDKHQLFCNRKLSYSAMACHIHAYCDQSYNCICKQGYEGNGRYECSEIDPCQKPDRGGCHLQATCTKTGPGTNKCQCEAGWVGDGKFCYRSIECMEHKDCHKNGMCRQHWTKTQSLCVCREGFHGNGTYCVPNDPCTVNNGNCHKKATCFTLGPGNHSCQCLDGYVGDGYVCMPTIYKVIEEDSRLNKLSEFLQKLGKEDILLSLTDNFTFFAPNDVAMEIVISRMESSYWDDPDNILNFIRFHTLSGLYSIQMLMSFELAHIRLPTLYDGFSLSVFKLNFSNNEDIYVAPHADTKLVSGIIDRDIPAVNGYVHVINKALEPFFPPSDTPMLDEFFNNHPEYSLFGDWLEMRKMMDNIMEMMQYTLLVPDNSAMVDHNISFVQSRYLKFYLLPKIRLLSSFDDGETVATALGSQQQLKFTRIGDQVYVNDVLITSPNMLTAGGVVHGLAGLLSPLLHQCNVTNVQTVFGECQSCSLRYYVCPNGYSQADNTEILNDCYYPYFDGYSRRGCRALCEKKTAVAECCQGYYGPSCRECPAGAEFPCNNNGVCHNGINGTGSCLCEPGFSGTACEFKVVNGTLKSWSISCSFNNGGCSTNATCEETLYDGTTCTCHQGLDGDGTACWNPCDVDNGGCHNNAHCIFIEGYGRNCSCYESFVGDGLFCVFAEKITSSKVIVYTVPVLAVLLLVVLVFIGIYIYHRQKTTDFIKILNKKDSSRSSICEPLHPDDRDNETSVSQPSPPPDVKFCNPLYNLDDEFQDNDL